MRSYLRKRKKIKEKVKCPTKANVQWTLLGRQRQEDRTSLGYKVSPCLRKKKKRMRRGERRGSSNQPWWHPALQKQRQEDLCESEVSLVYS